MELVLGGKGAVVQGEGAVVVASLAPPHSWRGFTQAAVNTVGVAEFRHGRFICVTRKKKKKRTGVCKADFTSPY